jgi:calcineurin-like phosphoesterase family protein
MKTFVISDTHFGHRNILKYEADSRPFDNIEQHDETMVRRWNAVVSPKDTVYHLGDVLFGENSFDILGRLNGTKNLILGNHDHYPLEKYAKYFKKIHAYHAIHGCLMSHIPIHESQFFRYKFNIHGHIHSRKLSDPRYICVSVEHTNLAPVLLADVINNATHVKD